MITEKIEKTILFFKGFTLKHTVVLGSKNLSGERRSEVFTNKYKSKKYKEKEFLTSIFVNTSDYLVFRYNKTEDSEGDDVYFSYPHIPNVINKLKKVKAYLDKKSDKIFLEKNGEILLNADFSSVVAKFYGVANKKIYVKFSVFHDKDDDYCGISLYFNKSSNIINLTYDELQSLIVVLENFNLYGNSLSLLNYSYLYALQAKTYKEKKKFIPKTTK